MPLPFFGRPRFFCCGESWRSSCILMFFSRTVWLPWTPNSFWMKSWPSRTFIRNSDVTSTVYGRINSTGDPDTVGSVDFSNLDSDPIFSGGWIRIQCKNFWAWLFSRNIKKILSLIKRFSMNITAWTEEKNKFDQSKSHLRRNLNNIIKV